MNAPIDNDKSLNLDDLWFEELGRSLIVGCESDRELFVDLPHVLDGPILRGEQLRVRRDSLAAD